MFKVLIQWILAKNHDISHDTAPLNTAENMMTVRLETLEGFHQFQEPMPVHNFFFPIGRNY